MVKNKTVNGIHIDKKGVAAVNSETERKLRILTQFQSLADTLVRPGMAKHDKLVTVFKYARDKNYRSIGSPSPTGHWDEMLAEAFLNADWADCTMAANGFAYLANAVGYTNVSVRLYGHGHCEIDRLIYDPGFAKTVADDEYTKDISQKTYAELEAWYTSDDTPTRVYLIRRCMDDKKYCFGMFLIKSVREVSSDALCLIGYSVGFPMRQKAFGGCTLASPSCPGALFFALVEMNGIAYNVMG